MKKLDLRLFLILLFFGTFLAKSVTSEKVCYGFMSDYLLLDENLDGCQESNTGNLSLLLILLEFWKLSFILSSGDLAIIYGIYLCSSVGYRFVSLSCTSLHNEREMQFVHKVCWSFSLSQKPATHLAKIARPANSNWLQFSLIDTICV